MISNVAGYYLWPPAWVGSGAPTPVTLETVKLLGEEAFRTTLTGGISLKVLRGGMFLFDFTNWLPGRPLPENSKASFDEEAKILLQRVAVLNAHLACLYTAIGTLQNYCHHKMAVSPGDLVTAKSLDDGGMGFGDPRTGWLVLAQYPNTYAPEVPVQADLRVFFRILVIEIPTLKQSFDLLDSILRHPHPDSLLIADLHMRSCKAYEDHNYALCLITSWAVTERLLQTLWTRYLDQNREKHIDGTSVTVINADRKSKLTETRDFTASVISEILSLTEQLPFDLYKDLSTIRKARNNWIHDLKPVPREAAGLSIETSERVLELVEGLKLKVPLVSQISG